MPCFKLHLLMPCFKLRRACVPLFLAGFFAQAFAYDAPVAFVDDFGCAPEGLPGWNTTPARVASTAFGVSGFMRPGEDDFLGEWVLSAAGEWGNPHYRVAFLYSYYALDSLFRESSAALETSVSKWFLVAGVGFGGVTQWVPGDAAWLRYRLKVGLSAQVRSFTLAAWWSAFTDEMQAYPRAGVYWEASRSFSAYAGTDLQTVSVGTLLRFAWGCVETSYTFPGFALSFGVSLAFDGYALGGKYGTSGGIPAWSGVWASKSFKK